MSQITHIKNPSDLKSNRYLYECIAYLINKNIESDVYIVAIGGPGGTGKSTFSSNLTKYLKGCSVLTLDDYKTSRAWEESEPYTHVPSSSLDDLDLTKEEIEAMDLTKEELEATTVKELKNKLKKLKLPTSGRKAELVKRLIDTGYFTTMPQ